MRSPIDALVTDKSLALISTSGNRDFLDLVLDGTIDANLPLKNVCAKVSSELSDEIDKVCDLLNISKRRFLEAAFIEAVQKAHAIMESEGVFQAMNPTVTPDEYDASRALDANE